MAETAEEAWKEYRKRGEAVETFEEFKARWEARQKHPIYQGDNYVHPIARRERGEDY